MGGSAVKGVICMTWFELKDILTAGGGAVVVLLTLFQIAPIKINPWTSILRWIGRGINAPTLEQITEVRKQQEKTQKALEAHIQTDDERAADAKREQILRFNTELLRKQRHTREDFIEILAVIDRYERYCDAHPSYQNNRATHAIANIARVYDDCLEHPEKFLTV